MEVYTYIEGRIIIHELNDYLYESENGSIDIDVDDMCISESINITNVISVKKWAPGIDKHCTIIWNDSGEVRRIDCYEDYDEVFETINNWNIKNGYKPLERY